MIDHEGPIPWSKIVALDHVRWARLSLVFLLLRRSRGVAEGSK